MSHFAVLVIGDNVEQQLAPYHEFECTGTNDQYVQDVDVTEEIAHGIAEGESLEEALDYYGLSDKIVASEAEVQKVGDDCPHKYGYAIVRDGQLIKAVNRTNPHRQWDWYQVGGRWSGFLKLKHGADGELGSKGLMGSCASDGPGRADQTTKGAIDFDGMRDEAGQEAANRWDKAAAAKNAAGFTAEATWDSRQTVRERHPGDIEAARAAYNSQPAVAALKNAFKDHFFFEPDQFLISRDDYIQQARDRATVTYAIVKDGEWIAKGEMGWWGLSDDKVSEADWNRKVNEMLDALPDDTLITVVDCHI